MERRGGSRRGIVWACGASGLWRLALAAAACCLLLALGAAPAGATISDLSGGAFQILAPGEEGGLQPGPFSSDQAELYNRLTRAQGKVSKHAIERDYVSEKLQEPHEAGDTEEFTSRAGLEI